MERNLDPKIIVMNVDVFQDIFSMAVSGAMECSSDMNAELEHVLKFNPDLRKIYKRDRKGEHEAYKKKLQEFRDFFQSAIGINKKIMVMYEESWQEVQLIRVLKEDQVVKMRFRFKNNEDKNPRIIQNIDIFHLIITPPIPSVEAIFPTLKD